MFRLGQWKKDPELVRFVEEFSDIDEFTDTERKRIEAFAESIPEASRLANESFFDKLPESIRNGLVEHRKNQLKNTNFSWTGYKDCPFVNKKQVEDYKRITDAGWYLQMYKIMVSTAGNAMARGYPISAKEVAWVCSDLDNGRKIRN